MKKKVIRKIILEWIEINLTIIARMSDNLEGYLKTFEVLRAGVTEWFVTAMESFRKCF